MTTTENIRTQLKALIAGRFSHLHEASEEQVRIRGHGCYVLSFDAKERTKENSGYGKNAGTRVREVGGGKQVPILHRTAVGIPVPRFPQRQDANSGSISAFFQGHADEVRPGIRGVCKSPRLKQSNRLIVSHLIQECYSITCAQLSFSLPF